MLRKFIQSTLKLVNETIRNRACNCKLGTRINKNKFWAKNGNGVWETQKPLKFLDYKCPSEHVSFLKLYIETLR